MTAEGTPQDNRSEALRRLLGTLGESLRHLTDDNREEHQRESLIAHASEMVQQHGGVVIPMPIDFSGMDREHAKLVSGLTDEQAKASLFLGQLDREHPYRVLFGKLSEAWCEAAMRGAVLIARHEIESHGAPDHGVGPREFSAAWSSIAMAAVLGAVRYGQEHPDAFKGLEGIKEGEIDESVSQLIAYAEEQFAAQHDEKEEPTEEA